MCRLRCKLLTISRHKPFANFITNGLLYSIADLNELLDRAPSLLSGQLLACPAAVALEVAVLDLVVGSIFCYSSVQQTVIISLGILMRVSAKLS